ncbi:hypothetical protein QUB56_11690 [Microcoleus sp. AR_TQ3_B6]|uniref:hypothetical protein n=1 Tax=Microcoleus sp. AR_TQ3_B6 TaxID=3055284 RepID=UPI002FD1C07D
MLDLYQEFSPHSAMPPADEQFTEAANHWDLENLYADLASAKGKRLTPKSFTCGGFCAVIVPEK